MIRGSVFTYFGLFLGFQIVFVKSELLTSAYASTPDFTDESVSGIVVKLSEITEKLDAIERRLKDITNTETINVDQMIAQTVKEYEMQRSVDRMSQKVDEITATQNEMKTELMLVSKNLEQLFMMDREKPEMQSKNSITNTSAIVELISSYRRETSEEIASLGKNVTTIAIAIADLRKLSPALEQHIANENQKLIDNIDGKNSKMMKLFQSMQRDMPAPQSYDVDEYLNRKLLPKLDKNFDSINTSLLLNRNYLEKHEKEVSQILSKYAQAEAKPSNCPCSTRTELRDLKSGVIGLKSSMNVITEIVKTDVFEGCTDAIKHFKKRGVYKLIIPGSGLGTFQAECLEDLNVETGWTVIQKRNDGSVDFNQNWYNYKHGFGDPHKDEYWLGLEKIHAITSRGRHTLYIEMKDHEGKKRTAKYTNFEIGNEKEGYYLKVVSNYSGDAGDSLGEANITRKFSTHDVDNDAVSSFNCADFFKSPWWYDTCKWSSLHGQYNNTKIGRGINWLTWLGNQYSLKYTLMAISDW